MSGQRGAEFPEGQDLLLPRHPGDDVAGETADQVLFLRREFQASYQNPCDRRKRVAIEVREGTQAMAFPAELHRFEQFENPRSLFFPKRPSRLVTVRRRAVMGGLGLTERFILRGDELPRERLQPLPQCAHFESRPASLRRFNSSTPSLLR